VSDHRGGMEALIGCAITSPCSVVASAHRVESCPEVKAGLREFIIATGYARGRSNPSGLAPKQGISVSFVRNDEWEKRTDSPVLKPGMRRATSSFCHV
jgi:hypothetical protein